MKSIWIIAKNTYREIIRDRIIYALIVFAIVMVGGALALGQLSFTEQARISANFGMAAIHLSSVIIAVFVGSTLVAKEIDKQTILSILSKPLSRTQFLMGKSFGLILIIASLILGLSLILVFVFWGLGVPITSSFLVAILGILIESLILMGLALMFSSFSSSFMVVSLTIGVFLIGHWVENLNFLSKKSSSVIFILFAKASVYGFPNLERFNWRDSILYGESVPIDEVLLTTTYGLGWWLAFLVITSLIFRNKNFA
ncbi:MAG: ABC transporter permease subunit [Bdellovibrionaceae bacterium]|nr:ABC transporter permease subunit [Pseudobdellovibrionaceae bacterium]